MPATNGRFLILSLIVALLAASLFAPGLPGEFVFDDIPNIVNNGVIHLAQLDISSMAKVAATPQLSGVMRVLPTLSFALDSWRGDGPDPLVFKTTNLVIHAITACALAWFFRSLLLVSSTPAARVKWLAPALALAWAAHPLQVSSVLYAVQRIQTMGTLFLVLALLAYLKARQAQIDGRPARTALLLTALLWVVAMGCKEDSVLLPAYAIALELTVLRFTAADARVAGLLRRGYLFATVAGAALYLLVVIPHYWTWDAYPARDFSTLERLLTQARVLCLYLWQILLPLPQHMPFYYDWVQPSRGLLHPWTTLPAVALVAALLALAWRLRAHQPLFSLGVFLFFGAHFIASNVVGLELAFEHRNHFALVGAVLAVGSFLARVSLRMRLPTAVQTVLLASILICLGVATTLRAHTWRDNLALASSSAQHAPTSARAWFQLCVSNLEAGGGAVPDNTRLDAAIEACSNGSELAPQALNNPALLIVLKSLNKDDASRDWQLFQSRLSTVDMSLENRRAALVFTHHMREGVPLDKSEVLEALATTHRRVNLGPFNTASIGYFIMNDLAEPDLAMPYFIRVIEDASPFDPFPQHLSAELREKGRMDLADRVEELGRSRFRAAAGIPDPE